MAILEDLIRSQSTLRDVHLSRYLVKTILKFWISDREIDEWASSKKIFFVLTIGRSGTKLLADLLDEAPGAYVVHEPVTEDFQAYQDAFHGEEEARGYIQRFRKKDIYLRCRDKEINTYGEVNSLLRRHCNASRQAFPNAIFIHLIRDGRDVVRSMMSRKTMTSDDPNTRRIYPKEGDPWKSQWPEMTRFERLCWYWQVENCYLRNSIGDTVQLERLVSDYDYFRENLLDRLGLIIPRETWEEAVDVPKNVTKRYQIPSWSDWPDDKMKAFKMICEEEMRRNGYEL